MSEIKLNKAEYSNAYDTCISSMENVKAKKISGNKYKKTDLPAAAVYVERLNTVTESLEGYKEMSQNVQKAVKNAIDTFVKMDS